MSDSSAASISLGQYNLCLYRAPCSPRSPSRGTPLIMPWMFSHTLGVLPRNKCYLLNTRRTYRPQFPETSWGLSVPSDLAPHHFVGTGYSSGKILQCSPFLKFKLSIIIKIKSTHNKARNPISVSILETSHYSDDSSSSLASWVSGCPTYIFLFSTLCFEYTLCLQKQGERN